MQSLKPILCAFFIGVFFGLILAYFWAGMQQLQEIQDSAILAEKQ